MSSNENGSGDGSSFEVENSPAYVMSSDENNDRSSSEVENLPASASAPLSNDVLVSLGKPEDLGTSRSNNTSTQSTETFNKDSLDIRQTVGQITHMAADFINEHIIAARYATVATVLLLGTYGVSKTPLFFRYKSVSDIPSEYFTKRRTLHGRIIHVLESNAAEATTSATTSSTAAERPVICLVRHLSPLGRLLTKSAFDFSLSNSPAVRLGGRVEDARDLLKVELGTFILYLMCICICTCIIWPQYTRFVLHLLSPYL